MIVFRRGWYVVRSGVGTKGRSMTMERGFSRMSDMEGAISQPLVGELAFQEAL